MAQETTRIWAAVKDSSGKIVPKVIDIEGDVPDEYHVRLHDTIRPFCFAGWIDGVPPDDYREGKADYAAWWWEEDARRADSERPTSFPARN
jgi:hypothetical protein